MSNDAYLAALEAMLALAPPAQRPIVEALCAAIDAAHPAACVLAWPKQKIVSFGFGPRKMSDHYAYVGLQPRHVNLGFYRGTSLTDPSSILEGSGKNLRHVKIRAVSQVSSAAVLALVLAAIAERGAQARPAA